MAIFRQSGWDYQHLLLMFFTHHKDSWVTWLKGLGEDATLSDILQTLDEHYGVVMMFNALSKEL